MISGILCIRMRGSSSHITLEFISDLKYTSFSVLVLGYIKNSLRMDEDTFFKIEMALREGINNAIIHGNDTNPDKNVCVTFTWSPSNLKIRIKDENRDKINFKKIKKKIMEKDLLSFNGRGILIMNSYMDKLDLKSTRTGNEIVMEKSL